MRWFVGFETTWSREIGSFWMSANWVHRVLNEAIIIPKASPE